MSTNKLIKNINIEGVEDIIGRKIDLKFDRPLTPNKTSVFIAPNGFGKSTIAKIFKSLNKQNFASTPHLCNSVKFTMSNNDELTADEEKNQIQEKYKMEVIQSGLQAKRIYPYSTAIGIKDVPLLDLVRDKGLVYKFADAKAGIECQTHKFFRNLTTESSFDNYVESKPEYFFNTTSPVGRMIRTEKFKKYVKSFLEQMNLCHKQKKKTAEADLSNWHTQKLDDYPELRSVLKDFKLDKNDIFEIYLFTDFIQIANILRSNEHRAEIKKRRKYLLQKCKENYLKETLNNFLMLDGRITFENKKGKLILKFSNGDIISNGERDIAILVAKATKILLDERDRSDSKDLIIMIDELFDYLDNANIMSAKYYFNLLIDEAKKMKKYIFIIFLTHLDAVHFSHINKKGHTYFFSKDQNYRENKPVASVVCNRYNRDEIEADTISKYFLHYSPECPTNKAVNDKLVEFNNEVLKEIENYKNDYEYCPISLSVFLRKKTEKIIYGQIQDEENKIKFISKKNTTNKIDFF